MPDNAHRSRTTAEDGDASNPQALQMARDESSMLPLSEDIGKFLEDAKKGKPRNFLLVCKGAKVVYLAVKKKRIKNSDLTEAKKNGFKGEGYHGTITGKGLELIFNLARSDGFEAEPVKAKVLKDFLAEQAEFTCKPSFAIVDLPLAMPFDEEDLSHPVVIRFQKVELAVGKFITAQPQRATELRDKLEEIRDVLFDGDFELAQRGLDQLVGQLKAGSTPPSETAAGVTAEPLPGAAAPPPGAAAPNAPAPGDAPPAAATPDDATSRKLADAFSRLSPMIATAITAQPAAKAEFRESIAAFKNAMAQLRFDEAKAALASLAKRLKEMSASAPTAGGPAVPGNSDYQQKFAEVDPLVQQALRQQLGDTSRMRALLAYATEKSAAGDFSNALKALAGLETLAKRALEGSDGRQTDVVKEGLVAERKKFVQSHWQNAVRSMEAEVDKLRSIDAEKVPVRMIVGMVAALHRWLTDFTKEINSAIEGTRAASDSDTSALSAARQAIRKLQSTAASDPLLRHLSQAKQQIGIAVDLGKVIETALSEIDAQLAG